MPVPIWMGLAVTHAAAFVLGQIAPWHYSDFASSCRTGADAARAIRRKLVEIQHLIWPIVRALEKVTSSTGDVYARLTSADMALRSVEIAEADLLSLRDDKLHDDIEACVSAIRGRIHNGHMSVIPAVIKHDDLDNEEGEGREKLGQLHYALKQLDIPACGRLVTILEARSTLTGFARHRLFGRRKASVS